MPNEVGSCTRDHKPPGRSVAARMSCARCSRGHLSSDRSLHHRFESRNRLELRPAGPPSRHGWPVPALTAQEIANDGAVGGIRPASRQIIAASSSGSIALKRRSHRIGGRRFTSYVERASLPPPVGSQGGPIARTGHRFEGACNLFAAQHHSQSLGFTRGD